jgi:hypothetical protein
VVTLALLLAACSPSTASGTSPSGGGGGGNLPTATQGTCANTLSLAQASAIVGEVTRVDALVTDAHSVLCTYYASNGGASLVMHIYYSANPQVLCNTVQAGYQHLMTLSGYGDAATVGYQDRFPAYTLFMVKGSAYVFIQSTAESLDTSLMQVKAVAQAILPKL